MLRQHKVQANPDLISLNSRSNVSQQFLINYVLSFVDHNLHCNLATRQRVLKGLREEEETR